MRWKHTAAGRSGKSQGYIYRRDSVVGRYDVRRFEKVKKTEILFDSIRVKDLINSSGRSIYEVLKEVFKLSEKDRREVMKSRDFMQSIKAESLLLAATEEQVNKFAKFKSQQDAVFTFTIRREMETMKYLTSFL